MIRGKDIILISGIEWDSLWQGSHEIATRLAKAGNRVLYIENIGVRTPTWKDKKRVVRRLKSWISSLTTRGVRQVENNLFVCSPLLLPPFGGRATRYINKNLLWFVPLVTRCLSMQNPIVWSFLPTDAALDLIALFRSTASTTVIYHCTADFSELIPEQAQLKQSETQLLRISDLVFTTCRQLADACAVSNKNVHIFSNGVDFEAFELHGDSDPAGQSNLALKARPIIGYVGGLHRFVDFALLVEMARLRPDWYWVFVGPVQTSVGELARLSNVHLLGQQPHKELGKLIRNFDVCLVPYLKNQATATVVPTKVNEYLAAGKPVVATELLTICDFNEQHNILITAPSKAEDFLRAIEKSLRLPNDAETIARRTQVAKLSDWRLLIAAMSDLIVKEVHF
ncbi:MAG: glycosyltransferase [Pyrinomonadaceae bacterium]